MDTGKIKQTDPERKFRRVLSADTLTGDRIKNEAGEDLGKVNEIMVDLQSGRVAYVVVSYGGVLGMGSKLFAVPWDAFRIDQDEKVFILNVEKQRLENAPGFDKDNWPDMADRTWGTKIHDFYGTRERWEERFKEDERAFRGRTL